MPQKKKAVKKDVKKVVKNVIKNSKQQPLLKNSININIDLDDDDKKKKKTKRKKRQQTQTTTDNNVSYVDELGKPISNEIINNRSFSQSYIPQPFSRNSSVIGTSFNESAIMDRVMEKMSKLNASNQSMNNSVLNQSTTAPAPPQLPRPARTALSTIAPASPSVAPQSLNFNLSSPVRQVGMTPLQASSLAMNRVQQFAMASQSAATISEEAINRIFQNTPAKESEDIMKVAEIVKNKYNAELLSVAHGAQRYNKFIMRFTNEYEGIKQNAQAEAKLGYEYYKLLP
jgi:hypothetical protein